MLKPYYGALLIAAATLVILLLHPMHHAHSAGSVRGVVKCDSYGCFPCQYTGNGTWDCRR